MSPSGKVCVFKVVEPGVENVLIVRRELEMTTCMLEEDTDLLEMVEAVSVVVTDDGGPEELRVESSEPILGSVLAPIDSGVEEDSICERVTDTVFVRDDPLDTGVDESVGRIKLSRPDESEDNSGRV